MEQEQFFKAISQNNLEEVKRAFSEGISDAGEDMHDFGTDYSLNVATQVFEGNRAIIDLLLENGADVNYTHSLFGSPLLLAILGNETELADYYLSIGADPTLVCPYLSQAYPGTVGIPVLDAALVGEGEMLGVMKKYGADLNYIGPEGLTTIHVAIKQGRPNVLNYLLQENPNLNAVWRKVYTPLNLAISVESDEMVLKLLEAGANPLFENENEGTSLMFAIEKGNLDIIDILIEKGADVNKADKSGCTPIQNLGVYKEDAVEILYRLLKAGANPNYESDYPLLLQAVDQDDITMVLLLLNSGAKMDVVNDMGDTALMRAVANTNPRMVRELLKAGADINATDNDGLTCLDFSYKRSFGREEIINILEDHAKNA